MFRVKTRNTFLNLFKARNKLNKEHHQKYGTFN